jgi:hypothetical protein
MPTYEFHSLCQKPKNGKCLIFLISCISFLNIQMIQFTYSILEVLAQVNIQHSSFFVFLQYKCPQLDLENENLIHGIHWTNNI